MPKLKAELMPIDGKYYGSVINLAVEGDELRRTASIEVWVNGVSNYTPSEREYDVKGEDGKFYVRSEYDDDPEFYEYEISDDHFESQTALDICNAIVKALDGLEVT